MESSDASPLRGRVSLGDMSRGRAIGTLSRLDRVRDPVPHETQAVYVHEHESGGVPDFVGEGAVAFGAALAEGDVSSRRGHGGQREAGRISAEAFDDVERVDYIPFHLRHLLAFGIAHQRMNVDVAERNAVVLHP